MKANELMIGDWVQILEPCKYHGAIGRIKTLIDHKDDETAYFKIFLRSNTIHIGIEDICSDDIKPIPLTAEILEKNGFIKSEEDPILMRGIGCAIIYGGYKRLDEDKFLNYGDNIYPIRYVHQLQHALRLCGIEKEIVL